MGAVQFDGLLSVLTASATVVPGETYEIWIGITDVGDGVWDSGIFLSVESLCGDSLLIPVAGFSTQVDGTTVTFANTSKYATAWNWDFGDSGNSTERYPSHNYANLNQQYSLLRTGDLPKGVYFLNVHVLGRETLVRKLVK